MNGLIRAVLMIEKYPEKIIGRKGLFEVVDFTFGYKEFYGDNTVTLLEGFDQYIEKKYNSKPNSYGWQGIIQNHCQDDAEAFDTFFLLFKKYLKLQNYTVLTLTELPQTLLRMEVDNQVLLFTSLFRSRSIAFLGKKRLSTLKSWISGYQFAMHDNPLVDRMVFDDFSRFIAEYFSSENQSDWYAAIMEKTSDEAEAFDMFYNAYQEYLGKRGIFLNWDVAPKIITPTSDVTGEE